MVHWIISNLPWKSLAIYFALECTILNWNGAESNDFAAATIIGVVFFMFYIMFTFAFLQAKFERIITGIIIPEFIDRRPFKELDIGKKEAILQEILGNVNNKVQLAIGTNYSYTNTFSLVDKYQQCMRNFDYKFNKVYRNLSVEDNVWDKIMSVALDCGTDNLNKPSKQRPVEIRGWDKIMLVARNIENEDIEYVMSKTYSPELIQTYGTIREN